MLTLLLCVALVAVAGEQGDAKDASEQVVWRRATGELVPPFSHEHSGSNRYRLLTKIHSAHTSSQQLLPSPVHASPWQQSRSVEYALPASRAMLPAGSRDQLGVSPYVHTPAETRLVAYTADSSLVISSLLRDDAMRDLVAPGVLEERETLVGVAQVDWVPHEWTEAYQVHAHEPLTLGPPPREVGLPPLHSQRPQRPTPDRKYRVQDHPFARGAYGEVWLAERVGEEGNDDDDDDTDDRGWAEDNSEAVGRVVHRAKYVLKSINARLSVELKRSALREVHFGLKLRGVPFVSRFVEWFDVDGVMWLVFRNEGTSLQSHLYSQEVNKGFVTLLPSPEWLAMKSDTSGDTMRSLIHGVLRGIAECHTRGVTHRDIKPSNVLLSEEGVRVADMGSAVDEEAIAHGLYGALGPSKREETLDYAPPEVIFGEMPYYTPDPRSYDLWSLGVLVLELILGTGKVFQISQRTRAVLNHRLAGRSDVEKAHAHLFRAFVEYCIYQPEVFAWDTARTAGSSHACNDTYVMEKLTRLDPLHQGPTDVWQLKLLRRLLSFDPSQRITADRALQHAYFHGHGFACGTCGREFEFDDELQAHRVTHVDVL